MSTEPNTRRVAVALEYETSRTEAPRVTANGRGLVAEEIIRLARASGVPVREDRDLVELLAKLEVGELIPPELYVVVAEVLAYLYRMNLRTAEAAAASVVQTRSRVQRAPARPPSGGLPIEQARSASVSGDARSMEQA